MKNIVPSEFAKACKTAIETHGTKTAAANSLGVSIATVSRYLKLLDYSEDELKLIDKGEKPVRSRKRSQRTRKISFDERTSKLMDILAHTVFATQKQLEQYTGFSFSVCRDTIYEAQRRKLIQKDQDYLPYAYHLTNRGANAIGTQLPKHFMSDAAIHQRLLRNTIELNAREKNPTATFASRPSLWRRGIYPVLGEWCLQYQDKEGNNKIALILIDDYGMPSERLHKSIHRNHAQTVDKATGKVKRNKVLMRNNDVLKDVCWKDVVSVFSVYSTSDTRIERYKKYIEKHADKFTSCKPVFAKIDAIWDVGI